MWETMLVWTHATAGAVAFAAGCWALRRHRVLTAHLSALAAMVGLVGAAVLVGWGRFGSGERIAFVFLIALGAYMVWRAYDAWLLVTRRRTWDAARYIDDVGFVLIALFDGFSIVAVVEMGGPGWAAASVGIFGVVVGHFALRRYQRRVAQSRGRAAEAASGEPARREPARREHAGGGAAGREPAGGGAVRREPAGGGATRREPARREPAGGGAVR